MQDPKRKVCVRASYSHQLYNNDDQIYVIEYHYQIMQSI